MEDPGPWWCGDMHQPWTATSRLCHGRRKQASFTDAAVILGFWDLPPGLKQTNVARLSDDKLKTALFIWRVFRNHSHSKERIISNLDDDSLSAWSYLEYLNKTELVETHFIQSFQFWYSKWNWWPLKLIFQPLILPTLTSFKEHLWVASLCAHQLLIYESDSYYLENF